MNSTEFRTKISSIAEAMGYAVTFTESGANYGLLEAPMQGNSRFKEQISVRSENGRLNIYGWYPNARDGSRWREEAVKITVAETKTGQQIVRDMERRFFPEYRAKLAKVVKEIGDYEEFLDNQDKTLKDLMEVAGIPKSQVRDDGRGNPTGFYLYTTDFARGEVKVSGGSVTMELRGMTPEQAKAVLKALKG